MSIELPQPVAAYPLPDGRVVTSQEEYIKEMTRHSVEARADAFLARHPELKEKRLSTRYRNTIIDFLTDEAIAANVSA
jgi:hypothetical protein